MADFKTAVCCVCWEKKGSRSMFLLPVNDNISDLIRLYIYDWFDLDLDIHPSVICTTYITPGMEIFGLQGVRR